MWEPHWLQVQWSQAWLATNIAAKELVAVLLAVGVWDKARADAHVCVRCDNMAEVEATKLGHTHDRLLMHMLRSMHFLCANYNIRVSVRHVAGVDNTQADALSRNNVTDFFSPFQRQIQCPHKCQKTS